MTPVLFATVRPKIYMVIKKSKPFELYVHCRPRPHTLEDGNHHIWTRFCDGLDIVPPGNSARKSRLDDANLGAFRRRLAYCGWARERHRSGGAHRATQRASIAQGTET